MAEPRVPLLLLHPLGSDRRFWDPLHPELGDRILRTPDLLGHGTCPPPAPGSGIPEITDDLVRRLAGELTTPMDVAGVSLGGLVAQDLAARYPDLVRRLILIDTVSVYPSQMKEMWRARAKQARETGLAGLTDAMSTMWFTDRFRSGESDAVETTLTRFLGMDPEGYARTCEALEQVDLTAEVDHIRAKTLVVCGSEDLPPFVQAARWLTSQLGARLVWLSGARHAAVLERTKEFGLAVREFLD